MGKKKEENAEEQMPAFVPDMFFIPGQLVMDRKMRPLDQLVYASVYWLERLKDGKCYASNKTLSKITGSSSSGVAGSLVRLRDAGYIHCEYDEYGGRVQIITLVSMTRTPYSNEQGGVTQMSNRSNNIKSNIYSQKIKKEATQLHLRYVRYFKIDPDVYDKASINEQRTLIQDVAQKRYKLTPKRLAKVAARLEDAGYEMCRKAINNLNKSSWHHGENADGWEADLYDFLFRNYEMVEKWANKSKER